ncbi:hypothetical protein NXH64_04690 [Butyrivibrio fibrisolvens]|uniref:hypothetical protein n=1 Tax=Pseudobutyrivibrio ruminis TaxID=46206 RepID=UPI00042A706B|nr:hypothetical protein [Pseudobutyrivibrio ruminis]MDC7278798.1 hypothetical protein [Butyrivibrio fibrisolvens]
MVKNKNTIINIIFVTACMFLAFYGLYYNSLANIWVMVVTIPVIGVLSLCAGRLRFDINLLFLMETFFVKAMLDQHTGREAIVPTTIAMPMLMYLFGKVLVAEKPIKKSVIVMGCITAGTTVLGLLDWHLTKRSPIYPMGYYSVAFTGDTFYTNRITFYFNFIFIGAFAIAGVFFLIYKMTSGNEKISNARPYIGTGLLVILLLGLLYKYVKTERFLAFKEGVHLIITKHWGNFGLDLTYNNSTSNMWLDYGRDYGILVFVTLFIFFILTIKDAIMLAANKHVGIFCKALLLSAFVGVNLYYFVEAFAYQFAYLWYIGLVVCGVISEVSHYGTEKVKTEEKTLSSYIDLMGDYQ